MVLFLNSAATIAAGGTTALLEVRLVKGSPGDREATLRGIFNLGGRGKTFNIDTIGRRILVGITFIITIFVNTFGLFTLTIITYFLFTLILFPLVSLLLLTFLLTLVLLSGETTPEGPVTSGGVCSGKEEEANENY